MKLNLFCNKNHLDGWVNVDAEAAHEPDEVVDLESPWPWEDGSVDYIRAHDGPEHCVDPIHFMNEAHRVLKDGGVIEIWVPSTDGRGAWQDPTHKSFWNINSFFYYREGDLNDLYPEITATFNWTNFQTAGGEHNIIHVLALGLKNEEWSDARMAEVKAGMEEIEGDD